MSVTATHANTRRHRRGPGELRGRRIRRRHRELARTRAVRAVRSPAVLSITAGAVVAVLLGVRPGLAPIPAYLFVAAAMTTVAVWTVGRAPWARAMAGIGLFLVLGDATVTSRATVAGPVATMVEGAFLLVMAAALLPRGGALRALGLVGLAGGGALATTSSAVGMTLVVPVVIVLVLTRAGRDPGRYSRRRSHSVRGRVARLVLVGLAGVGWWLLVRGTTPAAGDPVSLTAVGNAFQSPSATRIGHAAPYSLFADAMPIVGGFGVIPLAVTLALLAWGTASLWHVSSGGTARRGFAVASALAIGITATLVEAATLLGPPDLEAALVPAIAACALTPVLLLCGAVARPRAAQSSVENRK